jgi:hypothetical protein
MTDDFKSKLYDFTVKELRIEAIFSRLLIKETGISQERANELHAEAAAWVEQFHLMRRENTDAL